jgi:hypothetical protein
MAMTPLYRLARGRYARLAAQAALVAACAGLAAACGSTPAPSPPAHGGTHAASAGHSAGTTAESKVVLNITLRGEDGFQHWTLRCDPPSGADTAAMCDKILKSAVFNPPHGHYMCPMILANARVFTITGVLYGKRVYQTVVDGGCDLGRYSLMRQIFN